MHNPDDTPKSFLYPGGCRYQTAGVEPSVTAGRGFTTADVACLMTERVRFMQHGETGRLAQIFEGWEVPEGWYVIPNRVAFPPEDE